MRMDEKKIKVRRRRRIGCSVRGLLANTWFWLRCHRVAIWASIFYYSLVYFVLFIMQHGVDSIAVSFIFTTPHFCDTTLCSTLSLYLTFNTLSIFLTRLPICRSFSLLLIYFVSFPHHFSRPTPIVSVTLDHNCFSWPFFSSTLFLISNYSILFPSHLSFYYLDEMPPKRYTLQIVEA